MSTWTGKCFTIHYDHIFMQLVVYFWCFLKVVNGTKNILFWGALDRHRSDRGGFVTYLNLLLEVFNVLNGQVQHVCCVCLLQIEENNIGICVLHHSLTHKRWRVWLCATSQNVTLSMLGTRSCSFLIRSLILVLLTWRAVHTDYYLQLAQLCLGMQ